MVGKEPRIYRCPYEGLKVESHIHPKFAILQAGRTLGEMKHSVSLELPIQMAEMDKVVRLYTAWTRDCPQDAMDDETYNPPPLGDNSEDDDDKEETDDVNDPDYEDKTSRGRASRKRTSQGSPSRESKRPRRNLTCGKKHTGGKGKMFCSRASRECSPQASPLKRRRRNSTSKHTVSKGVRDDVNDPDYEDKTSCGRASRECSPTGSPLKHLRRNLTSKHTISDRAVCQHEQTVGKSKWTKGAILAWASRCGTLAPDISAVG